MRTYLLTWKPERSQWVNIDADYDRFLRAGRVRVSWSAGNNKHIAVGSRAFLMRQGRDRPGIIASGRVVRGSHLDRHWDDLRTDEMSLFVDVLLDSFLHPERDTILPRESLSFDAPRLWNTQASGVTVPPDAATRLERRWSAHLRDIARAPVRMAEEISELVGFPEGAKEKVVVNRYERDKRNRDACIKIHGCRCSVCSFDFGTVYGILGRNFIHVHHVTGVAQGGGRRRAPDPRKDLRPVCPNCHAMLHIGGNNRTIEELRHVIRRNE